MEELRDEIRAAFDKEQLAYPPTPALRLEAVEAAVARRRAPNLEWLAVAAAILITIAIVVGLMSSRFASRSSLPANPRPTPIADYGPPPGGVPLLYVRDPHNDAWLIGYDWQGHPRGTVKLTQPLPGVGMAPDGQSFLAGEGGKGGTGAFFDRLGQGIPWQGAIIGFAGGVWADDSRHRCSVSLNQQTFEWTLSIQLPGQAIKPVTVIARDQGVGQTGISVAACSLKNDQAILVRTTIASPSEVWVMRLSDGGILSHHTYAANQLANVVSSRDAAYVAENSMTSVAGTTPQGAMTTEVRRVSDWASVATLPAGPGVLGFSGDDSLLLISSLPTPAGQASHVSTYEWRSGRTLWHYDGPNELGSFAAQPGGRDFAIAVKVPGTQDSLRDILIVQSDGTTTKIPGRYTTTW
jgi:hypothetical protein